MLFLLIVLLSFLTMNSIHPQGTFRDICGFRLFLSPDGTIENVHHLFFASSGKSTTSTSFATIHYTAPGKIEIETTLLRSLHDFNPQISSNHSQGENLLLIFELIIELMQEGPYDYSIIIKNDPQIKTHAIKITLYYEKAHNPALSIDPSKCAFCNILRKQTSGTIIAENKHAFAFLKKRPTKTADFLISPKKHITNLKTFKSIFSSADGYGAILIDMIMLANQIAAGRPYTLQINNGANSSQSVFHLHAHISGNWPNPEKQ